MGAQRTDRVEPLIVERGPLLAVRAVTMRFGGITALDDVSMSIHEGQICGLIGPNGAGKTTLFNCISGIYRPNSGDIVFDGTQLLSRPYHEMAALGISRTFQNLGLFPDLSVLDNVMVGAHAQQRTGFLAASLRLPGVRGRERAVRDEALTVLERLALREVADRSVRDLPYGTLKRIEIARALMAHPRLVLLDEPAAGLNHTEVDQLADLIHRLRDEFALSVLLVEHHMAMVMAISDHVVVLDFGRRIAEGAPSEVAGDPVVIEAYLGSVA